jgi:hypothetical protein
LTTKGVSPAKPCQDLWITTDGSHVYIRSGGNGPRLAAEPGGGGEGNSQVRGKEVKVRPRVGDSAEAGRRHTARKKYGADVKLSQPGQPLTAGERRSSSSCRLLTRSERVAVRSASSRLTT